MKTTFLDYIKSRGYFNQCTNEEGLKKQLSKKLVAYTGFDCTAEYHVPCLRSFCLPVEARISCIAAAVARPRTVSVQVRAIAVSQLRHVLQQLLLDLVGVSQKSQAVLPDSLRELCVLCEVDPDNEKQLVLPKVHPGSPTGGSL